MELNLNNSVQLITIISFTSMLIKYLIVNPLQVAIGALQKSIDKMETVLADMTNEQKGIDKRLVAVEESAKSAHKRLDGMEVH